MNATERMQEANARELREVNAALRRYECGMAVKPMEHHEIKIRAVSNFTPGAVLAWFFTWTICIAGFSLIMAVMGIVTRVLKILVP